MLIGEGKPYLSVMTVLNQEQWKKLAAVQNKTPEQGSINAPEITKILLARIAATMSAFPGYAQVRRVHATLDPWTVENGMLTPTLKLKRPKVMEKFHAELDGMYSGH